MNGRAVESLLFLDMVAELAEELPAMEMIGVGEVQLRWSEDKVWLRVVRSRRARTRTRKRED